MFTISPITSPSDLNLLRDKSSFNYTYTKATIDLLKKNFGLKDSLYLIAKEGEELAGFCSIDRDWWEENFFFIREILVDPKFQKLGLGQILMSKCIEHAKTFKATGVVTETAFDNTPMQALCAKLNFKKWDNPKWKEGVTYKLVF